MSRAIELAYNAHAGQRYGEEPYTNHLLDVVCILYRFGYYSPVVIAAAIQSDHFEIRFYKKGTVHLKFRDKKLWEKFNITASAGKKWLGENTQSG